MRVHGPLGPLGRVGRSECGEEGTIAVYGGVHVFVLVRVRYTVLYGNACVS